MTVRKIARILKSKPAIEGAGVHLKRAFGFSQVPMMDPFLLLDDFHSHNPGDYLNGFPWHPHRGIETITYVLNGSVDHGDSMGNSGSIHSGEVQWMTAGSGIIHQEMPRGEQDGSLWGFQLWANLPAAHKMMEPRYRDVMSADIPEVTVGNGTKVKVICGKIEGAEGPVRGIVIEPQYLDILVPPRAVFRHSISREHTVIAYVIEGAGYFDDRDDAFAYDAEAESYVDLERSCLMAAESLVLFGAGDEVIVSSAERPLRFLLVSGKPIREPVAWYGPIVMNTQEELKTAFEEYHSGTFIKKN